MVTCLQLTKDVYRVGEWAPDSKDWTVAQSIGQSTAPWRDLVAEPWLVRARFLLGLETPLRVAAATSTGPLPMLLATTADLTAQLAEPVGQVARAWQSSDPTVPRGRWELSWVRVDWWRQADSTGVAVHRLSTLLASLQA